MRNYFGPAKKRPLLGSLLAILAIFLLGYNGHAEGSGEAAGEPVSIANQLVFGPEFTFAREGGQRINRNGPLNDLTRLNEWMKNHLINNQPEGEKFYFCSPAYCAEFRSPHNWNFATKFDQGVIEITMEPKTVTQFTQIQNDVQDAVFVSAANIGLFPSMYMGGGHISVSLEPFYQNPLLLRNFIVDLLNHNELGMGVMNYDNNNAMSPALFTEESRNEIKFAIEKFDGRLAAQDGSPDDLKRAAEQLLLQLKRAFEGDRSEFISTWRVSESMKFTSFSFIHADRIEIRSVRPQSSFYTFVNQIRLIRNRVAYLEGLGQPIPLELKVPLVDGLEPRGKHVTEPPVDPQLALQAFHVYLTESGEKWSDHRDYLWPAWITSGEVEKFENSDWFLANNRSVTQGECDSILGTP